MSVNNGKDVKLVPGDYGVSSIEPDCCCGELDCGEVVVHGLGLFNFCNE
jgi:hypothetical protein